MLVDPEPPPAAREFLPGSHLWLVERVRTANGKPFGFMQSWIPDELSPAVTVAAMLEKQSQYRLIADAFDIRPAEATEIIRAESATPDDAKALQVPLGSALLSTFRWTLGERGRPIEYVRSASPGELYEYVIKLHQ